VTELIKHGANVRMHCHRDGFSALHSAACFGFPSIARKIITAGGDVNAAFDPFWHTPLHLAAAKGQSECVALLLEAGARANARNKPGATPLRLAASNESELKNKTTFLEIAGLLLAAGANINERNDQGTYMPPRAGCPLRLPLTHLTTYRQHTLAWAHCQGGKL